jgi:4-hydroxybenzoate polyprenyltransferase
MNRSMQQLVLGTMLILPVACGGTTTPYSASLLYSCPTTANFTFTTVNYPGDMAFTQLLGINDSGVIVGYHGSGARRPAPEQGLRDR